MQTKVPFPFFDKIYRMSEPDLVIADWELWGEIVDSHIDSAQCLYGYGIQFYVSLDEGATMSKIDVNITHPAFTFDVPPLDKTLDLNNLPGSLIFNESSDFALVGLWRIYYQIYLNS